MNRYLTLGLAIVLAGVVVMGAVFIITTVQRQSAQTEEVTYEEFLEYEKYGLQDTSGAAIAQKLVEYEEQDGEITDDVVLASLADSLPDGSKLVSATMSDGKLEVDYVAQEENVYSRRVVLTYDVDGLWQISIRQDKEIITVSRDGKKNTIYVS